MGRWAYQIYNLVWDRVNTKNKLTRVYDWKKKEEFFKEILIIPVWAIYIRQDQSSATYFPSNNNKETTGVQYNFRYRKGYWLVHNEPHLKIKNDTVGLPVLYKV